MPSARAVAVSAALLPGLVSALVTEVYDNPNCTAGGLKSTGYKTMDLCLSGHEIFYKHTCNGTSADGGDDNATFVTEFYTDANCTTPHATKPNVSAALRVCLPDIVDTPALTYTQQQRWIKHTTCGYAGATRVTVEKFNDRGCPASALDKSEVWFFKEGCQENSQYDGTNWSTFSHKFTQNATVLELARYSTKNCTGEAQPSQVWWRYGHTPEQTAWECGFCGPHPLASKDPWKVSTATCAAPAANSTGGSTNSTNGSAANSTQGSANNSTNDQAANSSQGSAGNSAEGGAGGSGVASSSTRSAPLALAAIAAVAVLAQ